MKKKKILEIGAGAGFYSLWLAQQGHQVISVEPNPVLYQQLQKNAAQLPELSLKTHCGDETYIESLDETFDYILIMGPMYHLFKESERKHLIIQSLKRLNPGGQILSTHLSRVGLLNSWLHNNPALLLTELAGALEVIENGFDPKVPQLGQFRGNFDSLASIKSLFQSVNAQIISIQSLDPLIGSNDQIYNQLPENQKQVWSQLLYHLSFWPDLLGTARTWLVTTRAANP